MEEVKLIDMHQNNRESKKERRTQINEQYVNKKLDKVCGKPRKKKIQFYLNSEVSNEIEGSQSN